MLFSVSTRNFWRHNDFGSRSSPVRELQVRTPKFGFFRKSKCFSLLVKYELMKNKTTTKKSADLHLRRRYCLIFHVQNFVIHYSLAVLLRNQQKNSDIRFDFFFYYRNDSTNGFSDTPLSFSGKKQLFLKFSKIWKKIDFEAFFMHISL